MNSKPTGATANAGALGDRQASMIVAQGEETCAELPRVESIEELFAALESPLLVYALRLLNDMNLAEDTVQEAFLKLHGERDQVHEPRRWLYRTVHNLALNHQRRARKIVPLAPQAEAAPAPENDPPDLQPSPDEMAARVEGIGLVRLSVQGLDDRSRELIRLKFNEELSYKEISARTGLTVSHVGYLLHHALKAIAADLAKTGIVP
ncbi:MAG: RNA polymerase sigma factor [Verrucomicrobia bacterium]|nr:RNA polymerase sigma factor [Verrucomicrobiota bacterium]